MTKERNISFKKNILLFFFTLKSDVGKSNPGQCTFSKFKL